MVAQQFLVLFVVVRIRLGQQKSLVQIFGRGFFCCQNGTIHKYIKRATSPTMPDDKP